MPEEVLDLTTCKASDEEFVQMENLWKSILSRAKSVEPPDFGPHGPELPPGNCLLSDISVTNSGRQVIRFKDNVIFLNRFTWMVKNRVSSIPDVNEHGARIVIRHLCANKTCIFPDHLRAGTDLSNADDNRITLANRSTLSVKTVQAIRDSRPEKSMSQNHPDYVTQKQRAENFGVSIHQLHRIDRDAAYSHVPNSDGTMIDQTKHANVRKQARVLREQAKTTVWTEDNWKEVMIYLERRSHLDEASEVLNGEKCRLWDGSTNSGYGQATLFGFTIRAHVLAALVGNNYKCPPLDKLIARHQCHNPCCVEPKHLIFGNQLENMKDSALDGRLGRKLTKDNVLYIRREYYSRRRESVELQAMFNISQRLVSQIVNFKRWTHVTSPDVEELYFSFVKYGKWNDSFSADTVREMRALYKSGAATVDDLRKRFPDAKKVTIEKIVNYRSYKNVPDEAPPFVDPRIARQVKKERKAREESERYRVCFLHIFGPDVFDGADHASPNKRLKQTLE